MCGARRTHTSRRPNCPPTRSIDHMDVQTLSLSRRRIIGKKVKTLRRKGIVPVHMYGSGTEALSLQTDALELQQLLPRVGTNVPLSIRLEDDSGENICFVREVQRHLGDGGDPARRLSARGRVPGDTGRGADKRDRGVSRGARPQRHAAAPVAVYPRGGAADERAGRPWRWTFRAWTTSRRRCTWATFRWTHGSP